MLAIPDEVRAHTSSSADFHTETYPLHRAARAGDVDSVNHFLDTNEHGTDVNSVDHNGWTPLYYAARWAYGVTNGGHVTIVATLIAEGANVNVRTTRAGQGVLHWPAFYGNIPIVSILIAASVDVNAETNDGETPLHWGARRGPSIVSFLIAAGADANKKDNDGRTPLFWSVVGEDESVATIPLLVAGGASLNVKDNDGNTLLHGRDGSIDAAAVSILAAAGLDVNARNNDGETPLLATFRNAEQHTFALIAEGGHWGTACGDGEVVNWEGPTPPCRSAAEGDAILLAEVVKTDPNLATIQVFLGAGADPNAVTLGAPVLVTAAALGHAEVVGVLITAGASLNAEDGDGNTPLRAAHDNNHASIVSALIAAGGHWGTACESGEVVNPAGPDTPCISTGTGTGPTEIDPGATAKLLAEVVRASPSLVSVAALLEAGADPNAATLNVSVLVTAALLGHAEVVSVLITGGAEPDARFDGANVAHLMAATGGALTRAQKRDVLRHFADGIAAAGAAFDWNAEDGNNARPIALLRASHGSESAVEQRIIVLMGEIMLAGGARCPPGGGPAQQYHIVCTGFSGKDLADLVRQNSRLVSAAEARDAALTVINAGIPLEAAGHSNNGHLVALAALWSQPHALSVLLTFGMDPDGRDHAGHTALFHIAERLNAVAGLAALRAFIGGLEGSGRLTGPNAYAGWNSNLHTSARKPLLQIFQEERGADDSSDELDEMHALFYDYGSRCPEPGDLKYCQVPTETVTLTARTVGRVLSISRAPLGFESLPAVVLSSLVLHGWSATVLAEVSPQEFVVSRTRNQSEGGGDAAAVFTLTMTNAASSDAVSRIVMISLDAVLDTAYAALVSSVLEGDAAGARNELDALGAEGVDATTPDGVALLITAAVLGHAEVVSVLVAAGYDPDARAERLNQNIPLLAADHEGTHTREGGELPPGRRLAVLRHFGDALDVRGAVYDNWNLTDDDGHNFSDLLGLSAAQVFLGNSETPDSELLAMADYALSRGAHCGHKSGKAVYARYCIGGLGADLFDAITESVVDITAVGDAARAMADRGISITIAGGVYDSAVTANVLGIAMHRLEGEAVSVLAALGADPNSRGGGGRGAPHIAAAAVDSAPQGALGLLRGFIGGLSAAGKLGSFNGWNERISDESPLDLLQQTATLSADGLAEKREAHSLLYEFGARCGGANTGDYCAIPADNFALPREVEGAGAFLTLTARAFSNFQSPPIVAAVSSSLTENGWGHALNTGAEPDELVLSRTRIALSPEAPAVFTVTLTSVAGASREMRVWATVLQVDAPAAYHDLISAVAAGDGAETRDILLADSDSELTDAVDENGVPLLIVAATLGHRDVVTVLIGAGFNPEAQLNGETAPNVIRDGHYGGADETARMGYDAIADLFLSRGIGCSGGIEARYDPPCIGSSGAALVSLIAMTVAISDDDVRAAARAVADSGVSLDFVGADGAGELAALSAANGHSSAMSILVTFGWDPGGTGGGAERTEWTALHHIADSVRGNATVALESLRLFIGGLREAGKLGSFSGWNASSEAVTPPLDIFNREAVLTGEESSEEKLAMYELFYTYGAECAVDESATFPRDYIYCGGVPREEHSYLNVGATGPVVTISGFGVEGEEFVLPSPAVTARLFEYGWILESEPDASPPFVVLIRDAEGKANEPRLSFRLTLRANGRALRAYGIEMSAVEFEDCAAFNQEKDAQGVCLTTEEGLPVCSEGSTWIGGGTVTISGRLVSDCVRKDGEFRRTADQEEACVDYLGGEVVFDNKICRGIDKAGTFCILDSTGEDPAFPCRGLFRHILRCNLTYNRPALNPFICAASCGDMEDPNFTGPYARGAGGCEEEGVAEEN